LVEGPPPAPLPPVAEPPFAVEPVAPPVAVEVAVPDADPPLALWSLLLVPAPPAPPVTLRATELNAVLHCETLELCVLVLLPEFVADAPFDCVVLPFVADGLLLLVVLPFACVLVPPGAGLPSANAAPTPMQRATAATATLTHILRLTTFSPLFVSGFTNLAMPFRASQLLSAFVRV
jgi:hypothetical protein